MKAILKTVTIAVSLVMCTHSISAKVESLDKVAVIVDKGVVLESEIKQLVSSVKANAVTKGQSLPSDKALRTQAIERLILTNLQRQVAERMGIQVSDPQLDQTIENIAQSEGATVATLREQLNKDNIPYDLYREEVRQELIMGEVRRANVRRRIYITPQEITALLTMMDEQGAEQAEYRLGHILIGLPSEASEEEIVAARERADKVLALLNQGSDFTKMAIASSSGSKALDGGDMGWMNVNSMPTLFAEAVQNKDKNELVGPIRSGAGFHILQVTDTRGIEKVEIEEVNARHILVKPSIILSDQKAESMLMEFRDDVIAGEADFAELAKKHSEDPGSAIKGGELGWADPTNYVPEFKDALAKLSKDEFSKPIRTVHGWHLIQLIDRRLDDATDKRKEDKAYQLIFNRKFAEETDSWLREMRDEAYIEVLDTNV